MKKIVLSSFAAFLLLNGCSQSYNINPYEIESHQTVTVIEPPDNIKGDVARVYRYMEQVYWYKLISDKQKPLFDIWEIQDPVDSKECEIYKLKKEIQKSPMFILEESCKNFNK